MVEGKIKNPSHHREYSKCLPKCFVVSHADILGQPGRPFAHGRRPAGSQALAIFHNTKSIGSTLFRCRHQPWARIKAESNLFTYCRNSLYELTSNKHHRRWLVGVTLYRSVFGSVHYFQECGCFTSGLNRLAQVNNAAKIFIDHGDGAGQ